MPLLIIDLLHVHCLKSRSDSSFYKSVRSNGLFFFFGRGKNVNLVIVFNHAFFRCVLSG